MQPKGEFQISLKLQLTQKLTMQSLLIFIFNNTTWMLFKDCKTLFLKMMSVSHLYQNHLGRELACPT